jgi:tetratricopeptide (TPR) repeat protein
MTKNAIAFALCVYSLSLVNAQYAQVDKAKVQEYFQNQQFDDVIEYLLPAHMRDSNDLSVNNWLGYAYFMNDDYRKAKQSFNRIITIDSNHLTAIRYLAIINYNSDADEALHFYQQLVRMEPSKPAHYRHVGELWARKGKKDSALLFLNTAYAMAPKDYKNAAGLASHLIETKEYKRADSILDAGLQADSMNSYFLRLRLKSAYDAEDYISGIGPGEKLLLQEENSITSISQLIVCYYNLKRYEDCIRVCDYTQQQQITTETIYYYQARSYARLHDYEKSNELLRTCLLTAISKSAELYYYSLGENFEAMKQYKTAIAQYDTGYYLFKNPVMLYNCGRIYESQLNNKESGKRYYQRYLRFAKPVDPAERKAYEYVQRRVNAIK